MAQSILAVALLARPELQRLGSALDRAWPVDETRCFSRLLEAIDQADRQPSRERDSELVP